ncbi:MAG: prolipoprotein diacylglyceryl transferase [Nanoarchaeota archaeon]
MIEHTLNPVIVNLPGPLEIRYYGLIYVIGLAIGYFLLKHLVKEKKIKLTKEEVLDYIVYLAIGLLIGARVFYFIFYIPSVLLENPLNLLMIWDGGMSFHGGLVGAIIAGYIFCRKKKISSYKMADITVIPVAIALALGRIGDFINGELPGRTWQGALCINYENNPYLSSPPEGCRIPSQIIEALKNILIFSALWFARTKKLQEGSLLWLFVLLYGILRFLVEFIRQPDPQLGFFFGWMTMGQILSGIMVIVGSIMLYKLNYISTHKKQIKKSR